MIKELLRRAGFDDLAVVHEEHIVAHLAGKAHLVRDDHHRHAVGGQLAHDVEHLADHLRVQRGGRLVKEHHIRVHGQRAHDGHALPLPAGEVLRPGIPLVNQADALQQRPRLLLRRLPGGFAYAHRGNGDVVLHLQVRKQVELLEHHAHALAQDAELLLARGGHVVALEDDAAGGRLFQQVHRAQQRALARAGRADEHQHVALAHAHADALEHVQLAEALVQVVDFNQDIAAGAGIKRLCRHGASSSPAGTKAMSPHRSARSRSAPRRSAFQCSSS